MQDNWCRCQVLRGGQWGQHIIIQPVYTQRTRNKVLLDWGAHILQICIGCVSPFDKLHRREARYVCLCIVDLEIPSLNDGVCLEEETKWGHHLMTCESDHGSLMGFKSKKVGELCASIVSQNVET